jgi:hypothetical protein
MKKRAGYWKGKKLPVGMKRKIKASLRKSKALRSKVMKRAFAEGRLQAPWKGRHLPAEIRKRISETKKKMYDIHPSLRKKTSQFFKAYWKKHPEKQRRILEKTFDLWKKDRRLREAINRKLSIAGKKRFSKESEREKIDKAVTEFIRNHPHIRKEQSLRMIKYYESHPAAKEKLYGGRKNPFYPHIRTKSGFIVRSNGEKRIADFLSDEGIKFEYEKKVLYLPSSVYIPDFWLPKYNCFIEFYGQLPAAQKTKLEKYKDYRKFRIPCVFITPSELNDLGHYLTGELKKVSMSKECRDFRLSERERK